MREAEFAVVFQPVGQLAKREPFTWIIHETSEQDNRPPFFSSPGVYAWVEGDDRFS